MGSIRGALCISAAPMSMRPRLSGRRLHTEAVNAGKRCNGSPKRSSDKGCTWYCKLAVACSGLERTNAPNWLGAMASGPLRSYR
ncbi:hypothetical protein D9M71_830060 [compost metagenome]